MDVRKEIEKLQNIIKRLVKLDCCLGYTFSNNNYTKLWWLLSDARKLVK